MYQWLEPYPREALTKTIVDTATNTKPLLLALVLSACSYEETLRIKRHNDVRQLLTAILAYKECKVQQAFVLETEMYGEDSLIVEKGR